MWALFDLENAFDFNSNTQWQCRGGNGGTGVRACIAEYIAQ
jgi:hypothetical protein